MAGHRAPGDLALVQDFVNTYDHDEATDEVATPAELATWLRERGLLDDRPASDADHAAAVALREALRRLLLANNGADPAEADVAVLNAVAGSSGLRPRFSGRDGVRLEPAAAGVSGALGWVVAAVSAAMGEGTWGRLKACADDGCQWVFYDRSKNHSGHWCSMEVCGNRAKARQFRQRRRAGGER